MNKAELLWLWYDYHTEMYDQSLPSFPSRHDEGSVIVREDYRHFSNRNAIKMRTLISHIAKLYNISEDEMEAEKRYRNGSNTKRRLENYEWLKNNKPKEFTFIEDYIEGIHLP